MSAKEMFEMLGYKLDKQTIFYPLKYKYVCYRKEPYTILFTISDNEIVFKKYFNSDNGRDYSDYAYAIHRNELEAINKQVEELGWYE